METSWFCQLEGQGLEILSAALAVGDTRHSLLGQRLITRGEKLGGLHAPETEGPRQKVSHISFPVRKRLFRSVSSDTHHSQQPLPHLLLLPLFHLALGILSDLAEGIVAATLAIPPAL